MNLDAETRRHVERIERAVHTARVGSARIVILNGLEVDGKNDPVKNHILVSRKGWERMKRMSMSTRVGFVLHEYALVSGLDDHNYAISNSLVSRLREDRLSDDSQQESVLARFAEIRTKLHLAERSLFAAGSHYKVDTRTICRLSGLIHGAVLLFETTEILTTWSLTQTRDLTHDQLRVSAENLDRACAIGGAEKRISKNEGLTLVYNALRPLDAILR